MRKILALILTITSSVAFSETREFREEPRFGIGRNRPVSRANVEPTTSAAVASDPLKIQLNALQQSLETNFEQAPSIVQRVYSSSTSTTLTDYSDLEDSALLTGIYLASQCFREAAASDLTEKAAAQAQIQWALGSVENLFDVTGTTGLLARFAFNTTDASLQDLIFAKAANPQSGWTKSTALANWLWMSSTSRDQYTGVLFGLGICNQLTKDEDIRTRTASRISSAVTLLSQNNWSIPASTASSSKILISSQAAWLKLAAISSASDSERMNWETKYANVMTSLMTDLKQELEDEVNPTVINNFQQYYSWNLGYLRMYPILLFETNPTYIAYFQNFVTTKMWNETWNHGNSEFTFMKIGTMKIQSAHDQTALSQALESLNELAFRNRRDFPVDNTKNTALGRNGAITAITSFFTSLGIASASFVNPAQANNPIPVKDRAASDYMWQISPFQLVGAGTGTNEAPSVDTIFAYWLGQYHDLLSQATNLSLAGQSASAGATTSSGAKPVSNQNTNPVPSTAYIPAGRGGYESYRLVQTGTNYVGTLNYHGTISTSSESAQALDQSYNGVVQAGGMFFSTIHDDVVKAISDATTKLPGSHTVTVQLGTSLGMQLNGKGTYTAVTIFLPSITAYVGVKIEKAWGLIEVKCTETVIANGATVTGNLDISSGALTSIGIHAAATATTNCKDDIPVVGPALAHLIDHFAEKAIQPTIDKFNSTGGFSIKNVNFSGIDQLLKPGTFVENGQDDGQILSKDIVNFFNTDELIISINQPKAMLPADRVDASRFQKASTLQPIFSMSIIDSTTPVNNISLTVEEEQLYSAIGTWRRGNEP